MKAAIELSIFTAIAEGYDTAAPLAAHCQTSERGMRILCDYLTILGFLNKQDERYSLTSESELFLDRRSPAYVGGISTFLTSATFVDSYRKLTDIVRKGGTTLEAQGTVTPENPIWEDFARSMAAIARPQSEAIANIIGASEMGACKVLDIAAGHGFYGIAIARHNPQAQVYALDWQNVLPFATGNAKSAGVAERHHLIPGDAFEVEFGDDYDLVLLTNFFHHFDPPTCEMLMRKVHAALKDGGRAVTLEFVPDANRVTPPIEAAFALTMLISTPAGDAYTFAEYDEMFRNAGFSRNESIPLPPQHIIISHK